MAKKYVIIGNGIAGTTAAEQIRNLDPQGNIVILTDEDLPFYYRLRLNEYLSNAQAEKALSAKPPAWYEQHKIDLALKTRITDADPQQKLVFTHDRQQWPYDLLLLAMGSSAFRPPIPGAEIKGVFTLRSMQDAREVKEFGRTVADVVLIGGGLLGLETGHALIQSGKKVTIVESFPRLLPRQLDQVGAQRLQGLLEKLGFNFRLGAKTQAIQGQNQVAAVMLEGGENLAAQMVILSAGVRPNLDLAKPLGVKTDKGILINDHLQTDKPGIFAAGDVAQFGPMPYGIWPAAMEQGKIAGMNMAGNAVTYQGTILSNILKVAGVNLASAGDIDADNQFNAEIYEDQKNYKKIVIKENKIIGCIMLGDTKGFNQIIKTMNEKTDPAPVVKQVIDA